MAPCRIRVPSTSNLWALVDVVEKLVFERHELVIPSVQIIHAGDFLGPVEILLERGWTCGQSRRLQTVFHVYSELSDLSNKVAPTLLANLTDGNLVRRLHMAGLAIGRYRSPHAINTPPALRQLSGEISRLISSTTVPMLDLIEANEGQNLELGNVPGNFRQNVERLSEKIRAWLLCSIDLGGRPTVVVHTLDELKALRRVKTPHELQIASIDAAGHAPDYLTRTQELAEEGWSCYQVPAIQKVTQFVGLAVEIQDTILPKSGQQHGRRTATRLIKRAKEMAALAAPTPRSLIHYAGDLARDIQREAATFTPGGRWVKAISQLVHESLQTKIEMDEFGADE